jgi:hypothetical protein
MNESKNVSLLGQNLFPAQYHPFSIMSVAVVGEKHRRASIATTVEDVDKLVDTVASHAQEWVDVPYAEKLGFLKEMIVILSDIQGD